MKKKYPLQNFLFASLLTFGLTSKAQITEVVNFDFETGGSGAPSDFTNNTLLSLVADPAGTSNQVLRYYDGTNTFQFSRHSFTEIPTGQVALIKLRAYIPNPTTTLATATLRPGKENSSRRAQVQLSDNKFKTQLLGVETSVIPTTNIPYNQWIDIEFLLDPLGLKRVFTINGEVLSNTVPLASDIENFAMFEIGNRTGNELFIDDLIVEYADSEATLSVESFTNEQGYIYPNPVSSDLNINLTSIKSATVSVYNITGQKISEFAMNKETSFSMENLPKGIYFLNISSENKSYSQKVIKI